MNSRRDGLRRILYSVLEGPNMVRSLVFGLSFWAFGWSIVCGMQSQTDSSSVDWVTGSGDTLEFHVKGFAVDESGNRIKDATINCARRSSLGKEPLDVQTADDGGFLINIPCKKNWWTITVKGNSADGSFVGHQLITLDDLRRIARDGLTLKLHKLDGPSVRRVEVSVVDKNGPVPGASVKGMNGNGNDVTAIADDRGVATLSLPTNDELFRLTAWKGDQRGGGFSLQPDRDPKSNSYTVELDSTRPIKVRLVDEQGRPVPDVRFELSVSTRAPNYSFLGSTDYSLMTTNANGEADVNWFPDWTDANYYVELKTDDWLVRDRRRQPIEDNQIEVVLRKSRKDERQTVSGRVEFPEGSPAGFLVNVFSFQGEVEFRTDALTVFTDQDGKFFVDVLPGATYCYYIDDSQWLSEIHDAIFFDPETGERAKPVLKLVKGQKVEVIATQGRDNQPIPNQSIDLRSVHDYSWIEDGERRNGDGGRNWNVTTDANGRAMTFATPGELVASIYTPDWRIEKTVDVSKDRTAEIKLHRSIVNTISVKGKFSGADASELENAKVIVAALDGQTEGQQTVRLDVEGNFECSVKSAKIGIYAYTQDGRYSATRIVDMPPVGPIDLKLEPTVEYSGQLLDQGDQPIANASVNAKVQLDLGWSPNARIPRRLDGNTIETTTDNAGRYTLSGIPVGIRFVLEYQPADNSSAPTRIGERFVTMGENRPLDVFRPIQQTAKLPGFAERVQQRLGDCRRYGIYDLVVVLSDEMSTKWASEIISDYENRAILGYLPMLLETSKLDEQEDKKEFLEFLAKYDLTAPEAGRATLCVLDGDGKLLSRIDLDCADPNSMTAAREFIAKNEPPAADALQKLNAALTEARNTGRVVWAQHSQTRCGPCFKLSRWIEKHYDVLDKQFVFVKIDDVRDKNGIEVLKRVNRERHFGIPFVAIMNPDGEILIDGEGPLGNIGFPTEFESIQHLRKMISETGQQITDSELDTLITSLMDQ